MTKKKKKKKEKKTYLTMARIKQFNSFSCQVSSAFFTCRVGHVLKARGEERSGVESVIRGQKGRREESVQIRKINRKQSKPINKPSRIRTNEVSNQESQ